MKSKNSILAKGISVLIGANKMDLFTALPVTLVRDTLEKEITKIRSSRSKRLLDSGMGIGSNAEDEENDEWLGELGSTGFKFAQMEEFNISVEVAGGNVLGSGNADVEKWWNWIGERL
jgi:signal recognition particle receptor subunit beta